MYANGGGGATHIAKVNGLLSTLGNSKNQILIVAGGGGGGSRNGKPSIGGSGGGFQGNDGVNSFDGSIYYKGTGATQTEGGDNVYTTQFDVLGKGTFGQGGSYSRDSRENYASTSGPGGGGGFYGGGGGSRGHASGGGGSGYIGNTSLTNKEMYCYQCRESQDTDIKTTSTDTYSTDPISKYAKQGNGAARITYLG